MTKTKSDIVTGVCRELGIAPVEQGIESGPYAVVESVFENVMAELRANEVVAWGDELTPDESANALEVYIAQRAANRVPTDSGVRDYLLGLGRSAYTNFVATCAKRWTGTTQSSVDKF